MLRPRHVYALFPDKRDAIAAYREIQARGCPLEHCSVLVHEGRLAEGELGGPVESASHEGVWKGAVIGGATGAVLTGLIAGSGGLLGLGFLTGLAIGGGIMAIYGAIFGGIAGSDDAARHVRSLERALEEGEVLVAVKYDDPELGGICQEILNAHGGRSLEAAVAARPAPPLSPSEQADLLAALDDEYRALATYSRVVADFGDVAPFSEVAESERRHADALVRLLLRHGAPVPSNTWPDRAPRHASLREAYEAAVSAELENGALYERLLAGTTRPDLLGVYRQLQEASQQRHLPAFRSCAQRLGAAA